MIVYLNRKKNNTADSNDKRIVEMLTLIYDSNTIMSKICPLGVINIYWIGCMPEFLACRKFEFVFQLFDAASNVNIQCSINNDHVPCNDSNYN